MNDTKKPTGPLAIVGQSIAVVGFFVAGELGADVDLQPGVESAAALLVSVGLALFFPASAVDKLRRLFGGAVMLLAVGASGCASNTVPKALELGSYVVEDASPVIAAYFDGRVEECRDRFPPPGLTTTATVAAAARVGVWNCMEPAFAARDARIATSRLLHAAEDVWNASGREGFAAMAPCLLDAAEELLRGMVAIVDDVPAELPEFIRLARQFVSPGETCGREVVP